MMSGMKAVQFRMARFALDRIAKQTAGLADGSHIVVARFEKMEDLKPCIANAIRVAIETVGIVLIAGNGDGAGVRLRKNT